MTPKYYVDTAIWRDLHENRNDSSKNLGQLAFEFFKMVSVKKYRGIYSEFIVEELSHAYDKQTIVNLFRDLSELLEKAEINAHQIKEALSLCSHLNIPLGDALHGILARDSNAIMVTRDRHFRKLNAMVTIKKPEDLI